MTNTSKIKKVGEYKFQILIACKRDEGDVLLDANVLILHKSEPAINLVGVTLLQPEGRAPRIGMPATHSLTPSGYPRTHCKVQLRDRGLENAIEAELMSIYFGAYQPLPERMLDEAYRQVDSSSQQAQGDVW